MTPEARQQLEALWAIARAAAEAALIAETLPTPMRIIVGKPDGGAAVQCLGISRAEFENDRAFYIANEGKEIGERIYASSVDDWLGDHLWHQLYEAAAERAEPQTAILLEIVA